MAYVSVERERELKVMSEIKVVDVMRNDQGLLVHEEAASTPNLNEKRRLASLDIFRGLTVAVSFFSLYLSTPPLNFQT